MGTRIDGLEKNVTDLMTQAGMEDQNKIKQVLDFFIVYIKVSMAYNVMFLFFSSQGVQTLKRDQACQSTDQKI